MEGNRRFVEGRCVPQLYSPAHLAELAVGQTPMAAIVTCSDSRVVPEVIFDQPLGSLFVSRVPGNVASDSAKWMIDIAVGDFQVPLLIVMGHTGCLAVGQVVNGQTGGAGGPLRLNVLSAVYRAQRLNPADLWLQSIIENAKQTVERLADESYALRSALADGRIHAATMLYDMSTGVASII
ncbi:MAG: carbonic anhydrase [Fimbriimonadaceae bacterium]